MFTLFATQYSFCFDATVEFCLGQFSSLAACQRVIEGRSFATVYAVEANGVRHSLKG